MSPGRAGEGPSALDLLEESTHLVRCVPAAAAAAYLLGTVPFVLGLTFFMADMSRGVHAAARLAGEALALTAGFAWMKAWQAVAAEHALAHLERRAAHIPGFRTWIRVLARQFAVHGPGLLILPLASVLALPFGWVYAYYQNVTVLGLSEDEDTHRVAAAQARLWPGQNHGALGVVSMISLLVAGNVGVAVYAAPWLVRTITGTGQVYAQSGWNPLNTTFLAAVLALAWLVIDPVLKAFYILRCFYGRSRRTGIDLLVQVRGALARNPALVVVVAVLATAAVAGPARAAAEARREGPSIALEPAPMAPGALDRALDHVLEKPEYIWREPPSRPEGVVADTAKWIRDVSEALARWWRGLFERDDAEAGPSGWGGFLGGTGSTVLWLVIVLALILVAAVVVSIVRRSAAVEPPAPAAADVRRVALERDDLTADQLDEEEWMRLAREMIARGDIRLGMRALFLGSLAGLAARGFLALARHKSNRDYERELARRGLPLQALVSAYAENRRAFEGVWYGDRVPDASALGRFEHNVRVLVHKEGR